MWSQQERPAPRRTAGRGFEGRSVWGFAAQVAEELWEVQCIQMPGAVGSEPSHRDMHNALKTFRNIDFLQVQRFHRTKNKNKKQQKKQTKQNKLG